MVPAAISVTNETKPLTIWWHAQSIADTIWRLHRIPALEAAIFARGHVEFAEAFNDHDPSLRSSMIELPATGSRAMQTSKQKPRRAWNSR
jgi:hypothetical protein